MMGVCFGGSGKIDSMEERGIRAMDGKISSGVLLQVGHGKNGN